MVNADKKLIFQSLQAGALHAVTFKDNRGIIVAIDL